MSLSPFRLELAGPERLQSDGAPGSAASDTASLAEEWTHVAETCRQNRASAFAWATNSTLLGVAAASLAESEFLLAAREQARGRGATTQLVLGPHSDEFHGEDYRSWLPFADQIESGALRAAAYCNPGIALAHLPAIVPLHACIAYDDRQQTVALNSDTDIVEFAADVVASSGLARGVFPEEALVLTADAARARLRQIGELRAALAAVGGGEIRFHADIPVIEIGGRLVYDADGRDLRVALADDHIAAIVGAATDPLSPPCTCGAERWPSRVLRPRADIYSFRAGDGPRDFLYAHMGDRHCVVYEIACPHASRRPTVSEWMSAGWDWDRCERAWNETPLQSDIQIALRADWNCRTGIAWGLELGGLVTSDLHLAALAATLGFDGEQTLTAYVPRANVVLLSDEAIVSESDADAITEESLLAIEMGEDLPLGPPVEYLVRKRVVASPSLRVSVMPLDIGVPALVAPSPIGG